LARLLAAIFICCANEDFQKASITCQYTESNRSTHITALNDADRSNQQNESAQELYALPSSQDSEHGDLFTDNFTNILTPDFHCDDLVHVPISNDPMDSYDWTQLVDVFGVPFPETSPSIELLEDTRLYEDTRSRSSNTDPCPHDDMHYYRNAKDLSRGYIVPTSTAVNGTGKC
jgi:hypothetical protein